MSTKAGNIEICRREESTKGERREKRVCVCQYTLLGRFGRFVLSVLSSLRCGVINLLEAELKFD